MLIAPLLDEVARQQGVTHKALEASLAERLGIAPATVRAWGTGYARPQHDDQVRALAALARDVAHWPPARLAELLACVDARPPLRDALLAEAVQRSERSSPQIPVIATNRILGREALIDRIATLLVPGETLALIGMGGIGKTTLAALATIAQSVRARFYDGVLWTSLGPAPDAFFEMGQWISAADPRTADLAALPTVPARQARLREALGSRRMLLVIDDAWEAGHASEFILGGPNCAHLVTTRDSSLAALLCAPDGCIRVPDLDEAASARLLTGLAPGLARHPQTHLARLNQYAGGLPLALTIFGRLAWRAESADPAHGIDALLDSLASASCRV